MEEIVKGVVFDLVEGVYIVEKKGFFSWICCFKIFGLNRRKLIVGKYVLEKSDNYLNMSFIMGFSKISIGFDQ